MKPDKVAIAMACFTLAFGLFLVAQFCYGEDLLGSNWRGAESFVSIAEPTFKGTLSGQIKIIGTDEKLNELKLHADQIKTICIEYQGATRCCDTSLLFFLMPSEKEAVTR
jgi:hypothetical protein